jgi:hypothetical protein
MSLDHSTARPLTGDHDPFYDATSEAIDELRDRLESGEDGEAIHVPAGVAATLDSDHWDVDSQGNAYLTDDEGNTYELDVESGGYRQEDADVLLAEDGDEMRVVAGNADVFTVRGDNDKKWPDCRVPEGMYEAAFDDMAEHNDDDTVYERFYELSDAVLADRLDPDAETIVVAVTGPNLSPLYDNDILTEALNEAGYDVETVGIDDDGAWTGDVWEVDETDFYEMEDDTVMLRSWDGTFRGTLETFYDDDEQLQHDPVWRYLNDHPDIDDTTDLRVYPAWVPGPAGEDVEDAQVYHHTRTEISRLLSDINTPWRDIEARRPRHESSSKTTSIELNSGQEPFSEDPADWLFLNIMNGAGAAYPYFTIPNSGDVEQKLEIVEDVMEQMTDMADRATTWQEASNYLPSRWDVSMDQVEEENAFIEAAIGSGELEVVEERRAERVEEDFSSDRAYSDVTLRTGGEELQFTYGDGGLTSEQVLDPDVRNDNMDFYRLLDWFDDRGVDIDYERIHTDEYESLLRDEVERQIAGARERFEDLEDKEFDLFGRHSPEELLERYPDKHVLQLVGEARGNRLKNKVAAVRTRQHLEELEDSHPDPDSLQDQYNELDDIEDRLRYSPIGSHEHAHAIRKVVDPTKRASRRLHELEDGDLPDNPYTKDLPDDDSPSLREEIREARQFFEEHLDEQAGEGERRALGGF